MTDHTPSGLPQPQTVTEQAAPVAWTNPEGLRKLQRGFGVTVSPTPQMHPEGETALYLGAASPAPVAPVEAESAAEELLTEIRTALNASGVWHLGMDTVDVIKSMIKNDARYRRLRDESIDSPDGLEINVVQAARPFTDEYSIDLFGETLDAAVDAAMGTPAAAEPGKGERK